MHKQIIRISLIALSLIVFFVPEVNAQCQACKSTVESNLANGGNSGIGLNSGILYLLAMPYLLVVSIAALWYFKWRKPS